MLLCSGSRTEVRRDIHARTHTHLHTHTHTPLLAHLSPSADLAECMACSRKNGAGQLTAVKCAPADCLTVRVGYDLLLRDGAGEPGTRAALSSAQLCTTACRPDLSAAGSCQAHPWLFPGSLAAPCTPWLSWVNSLSCVHSLALPCHNCRLGSIPVCSFLNLTCCRACATHAAGWPPILLQLQLGVPGVSMVPFSLVSPMAHTMLGVPPGNPALLPQYPLDTQLPKVRLKGRPRAAAAVPA